MNLAIGEVVSIYDENGGERIKVRILPSDKNNNVENIPYASPLLPMMLRVKPKVGEAVLILFEDSNKPKSQRWYIGPIISQIQHLNNDSYTFGATSLLKSNIKVPDYSAYDMKKSDGALPKDDDVVVFGRKNTEIVLSDNDVRIRSGVKLLEGSDVVYNNTDPSYIKLKYHEDGLLGNDGREIKSTASIVANEINLISHNGDPYINTSNKDEGISDKDMLEIISKCHCLPYGDKLAELLESLIKMFKSHTHKYANMPPCPNTDSAIFDSSYPNKQAIESKILSKNVRIN